MPRAVPPVPICPSRCLLVCFSIDSSVGGGLTRLLRSCLSTSLCARDAKLCTRPARGKRAIAGMRSVLHNAFLTTRVQWWHSCDQLWHYSRYARLGSPLSCRGLP